MKRAERAKEAARLRAQGLNGLQIARRMGVSRSYAYELLNDPDGFKVRERKDSYRGECEDCGAPTDGSNGRAAPRFCQTCRNEREHARASERIISELQRWQQLYGRPPQAVDWSLSNLYYRRRNPQHGRESDAYIAEIERRHREHGPWPSLKGAQSVFGSWNAAIEAAGFEPLGVGKHRKVAA